jgi:hypothetical protein
MPTFNKLSEDEVKAMQSHRRGSIDLTEYLDFVRDLSPGEGGELSLEEGEPVRTVKRRMTRAATQLNKQIRWRRSQNGTLRFEVR